MKITKKDIGRVVVNRSGVRFVITQIFDGIVTAYNSKGKYGIDFAKNGKFGTAGKWSAFDIIGFAGEITDWKKRALKAEKELAAFKEKTNGLL